MICDRAAALLLGGFLLLAGRPVGWGVPPSQGYGIVQTLEGETLAGEIQIDSGAITVTSNDVARPVRLAQLASLRFQPRPEPASAQQGLRGTYFSTRDFQGRSAVRIDPGIGFDWGNQSPMEGIGPDNFSVRWEGVLQAPVTGRYVFHAETDDGVRLWMEQNKLIDQWRDQSVTETRGEIDLTAGERYELKLEYYEGGGQAVCRLYWTVPGRGRSSVPQEHLFPAEVPAPAPPLPSSEPHGLLGLYFSNTNFTGRFVSVTNKTVDFNWGNRPPVEGIPSDQFGVRWLGRLRPPKTGSYTFQVQADDGVRLWLDKALLIDRWRDGSSTTDSEPIALTAEKDYFIQMEMYENRVEARARLLWRVENQPWAVIPTPSLFPVAPPEDGRVVPENKTGVLLRNGSFIALAVHSADDLELRFSGSRKGPTVPTTSVAQIVFQSLSSSLADRLESGRSGLLLKSGDFVDGQLREYQNGRIQLNSVLLGLKTYRKDQAVLLALHEVVSGSAPFEVCTRNGSRFLAEEIVLGNGQIELRDPSLSDWIVQSSELVELQRHTPLAAR